MFAIDWKNICYKILYVLRTIEQIIHIFTYIVCASLSMKVYHVAAWETTIVIMYIVQLNFFFSYSY